MQYVDWAWQVIESAVIHSPDNKELWAYMLFTPRHGQTQTAGDLGSTEQFIAETPRPFALLPPVG